MRTLRDASLLLGWLLALTGPVAAVGLSVDDVVPNFIGLGVGSTTQWHGSRDRMVGAMPGARLKLQGSRFLEWYGPYMGLNLLDDEGWEAGPLLNLRLGREEVDDPVVAQLPEIGLGLEAGGFVAWHHVNLTGIPYRLRLGLMASHAVLGQTEGSQLTPYASLWLPLSERLFIGSGVGATWSDKNFMQQFFSVSPAAAEASGLPSYQAGAGFRQIYWWPGVLWRIAPQWMLGAGAYGQYLVGDAADSPIIRERGDRWQWTFGLGLGYLW
ncbi:MipA/OmpV family protein [Pseudaeromonas sp. ZJS20]|uniref:MipA/OmpV family protein n=1 Tax=Pseudaeromonas aegiceratis TaxID=3153928 RepID=UPI00390CAD25